MRNPFRRRYPELPPAPPGMQDFWATIHVVLREPISDVDDPEAPPVQGYWRGLCLRADPARIRDVISATIEDGVIEWARCEWREVNVESLDRDVRKRVLPIAGEGMWYTIGRVFYADSDETDEDEALEHQAPN